MNKEFANWLSLSGDLTESADTGRIVCPSCGKGPIDFRFVGRIATALVTWMFGVVLVCAAFTFRG